MTTPTVAAASPQPAAVQEPKTFDQALDQRRRAQAGEGTIPADLVELGEKALRFSTHMQGTGQSVQPLASDVPNTALAPKSAAANPGKQPAGDDLMTRAKQLIDSSFGYAVLTQQVIRGANQVASGMMTLLRST